MTRECQVRICEGLGVKFPGPTRQNPKLPHRNMADRFTSISGLGERGELVALLLYAGAEFGRSEHGHDLTGGAKPLGDDRILGDFLEIRRNALAQFVRHAARAKHPANALECQRRVAGFCRGRDVGHTRRALAAGHRQHLDAASLAQWLHHRKRRRENLDTTLGEIVRRLHDVAIGHPHSVESYWPYATTLFDYVRRAMPFQAPGSLTADEVYSVSAYILAEANIIDKTTVLDAQSLPSVQMPNREGFIPDPRPELFK
jgi:hypothetical protein